MDPPFETFELDGKTVKLYHDDDAESPREWSNLGHMVCWHRRYKLGDEQVRRPGDCEEQVEQAFIALPLYIYDHGGITITARYETYLRYPDKQWDAGLVGFICITREEVKKEYGAKRISHKLKERVKEALSAEVETYDQYLTGDVWGYVIEDQDGEHLDSCWGLYGLDYARAEATAAAKEVSNVSLAS